MPVILALGICAITYVAPHKKIDGSAKGGFFIMLAILLVAFWAMLN